MSKQDTIASTVDETRGRVAHRLHELQTQRQLQPLRDLFTRELNYRYANDRLNLPDARGQDLLYENEHPRIIATNDDGGFAIIYIRLRGSLSLGHERTLISRLLQKNQLYALFIFSDKEQSRWHFVNVKEGVGEAKRRLFRRITIGPEEQLRTAIERIAMLDLSTMSDDISILPALTIQDAFDRAFDVEAVTRTFFRDYRTTFDILQKDLRQQTGDETWAHDYALQLLNRCMFLYFIQRKRWLNDDTEFLKTFWEAYNPSNPEEPDTFVSVWLNTLFFKAFNDKYNQAFNHFPENIHFILTQAPYLNGGLFTENDLDGKHTFVVSDARFKQIFDLFQHYNFTIAEDSPLDQEVAVDPEMIGTVYESLVNVSTEVDERSDAGIFYTPRTEIDLMCRLSLVDYLTNHLGEEHKHLLYDAVFAIELEDKEDINKRLMKAELWQDIYDRLVSVKVVDPACGSGAFLVGMLSVLDDLMERAVTALGLEDSYLNDADKPATTSKKLYNAYERKKRIIGQSLYGVDVMEWAIHIAELRLWLALVVDAELHNRFEPLLPYFTFNVRCGDSLVQEVGGIKLGLKHEKDLHDDLKDRVEWLRRQKLAFYNNYSRDVDKKERIEHEERRLFTDLLINHIRKLEIEKVTAILKVEDVSKEQLSLIENTPMQPSTELLKRRRELEVRENELAQLKKTREALRTSKILPFVWDIAFGEIFAGKRRFDIVIGNPPYLRQEQIHTPYLKDTTKEDNKAYKTKLAHMVYELFPHFFGYPDKHGRSLPTRTINQKSDLYIYFYLLGLSLLNDKGAFCFITSNSWLDVGYGADLQEFLLKHCHIKLILDNETMRSFVSASVNTIIAHFSPPNEESDWGLKETARFVMSRVPFEQLLTPGIFETIESARERQTRTEYRVFPIQQQALLEDGKVLLAESDDEEQEQTSKKSKKLTVVAESGIPYTGNKWGGKYLRAPDIYWTIMEKGKDKLVRLGDVAEVRRGITTGANEFFYLDEATARQWSIEPEFLVPVIKSPRECRSILINPNTLKSKLFMCHKSKTELKGTKALKYIEWGESQGFQRRPSCAGRARWWDLGERRIPPIISPSSVSELPRTFKNDTVLADKRLYEIYPYSKLNPVLLATNSIMSSLFLELGSRTGLGEGLLDLTVYELADCLIALPKESKEVEQALIDAEKRQFLPFEEELQHPNRKAIDTITFDVLHLTQGERDGVYEAVRTLVNSRLNKAKSVTTSKETRKRVETVRKLTGVWVGVPDVEEEEEEVLGGFSA